MSVIWLATPHFWQNLRQTPPQKMADFAKRGSKICHSATDPPKNGRFLQKNRGGVAQDEDLGRTQPDFVEQPRFQSHHRDLAASELEIGLGRALVLKN